MKKIAISLGIIGVVAAIVIGATTAYFSDTETSTGNTFTAGSIDLKIDNTCYFNKIADGNPNCPTVVDAQGNPILLTSWSENDLGAIHKFFYFTDLKPGDFGEDTVSLHVYDNDAWVRLIIDKLVDIDNGCVDPELNPVDEDCMNVGDLGDDGELRENLNFWVWLDQGVTPGFQGREDLGEGDNVWQEQYHEPMLITPGPIDEGGEEWYLSDGIPLVYLTYGCTDPTGKTDPCKGITSDGHIVGSVTYYFGIGWNLPYGVGNIAQTDKFSGDMTLQAVQYRNNPGESY